MKICIASPDIVGPIANGGVGTACTALAQTLAAAGHQVTLFYTSNYLERGTNAQWQEFYAQFGVEYVMLDRSIKPPPHISTTVYDEDNIARAYFVYEQLKDRDFDLIHFVDYIGLGYFCVVAKSQGLHFQNTLLAVTTHSPTLWSRLSNNRPVDDISFMIRDRMERRLIELCDLVISPSRYMLEWIEKQGWALPARRMVIPNLLPSKLQAETFAVRPPSPKPIKEIVFFGRLEARKGLQIFYDAIDRIRQTLPPDLKITLLGKLSPEFPLEALEGRAKKWQQDVEFLTDFDTFQAVEYLKGDGRLAVLAALADNSPYTAFECLFYQVPFISSHVGGVAELIAPDDQELVLYPPTPAGLAKQLMAVLAMPAGSFRPARPSFDFEANRLRHVTLYEELSGEMAMQAQPAAAAAPQPLVTATILHYERPDDLERALASLERQSYASLEIVVVDNGSRSPEALAYLERLSQLGLPSGRPLTLIRLPENVYEAAGRNAGAAAAKGKYVLFMDDDNLAKPKEIELFCRAAENSGADVLTCFTDHFALESPPESDAEAMKRFVVIGDFGPLGMLLNSYGDLNCFCRRDRFLEIGGFTEDGRFNHAEDWRFFAKAWSKGLKLEVVPEALVWYRSGAGASWTQNWRKRDRGGALMRAAQAYLQEAPPEVAPFVYLAQGLFWKSVTTESARRKASEDARALRQENERLSQTLAQLQINHECLVANYQVIGAFLAQALGQISNHSPEIRRGLEQIQTMSRKIPLSASCPRLVAPRQPLGMGFYDSDVAL